MLPLLYKLGRISSLIWIRVEHLNSNENKGVFPARGVYAEIRLFPLKGACNAVLGKHNKKIQDSSITASSQLSLNHVPSLARLDSVQGAWCSAPTDNLPYIEILLSEEKFLTLIKTQGSKKDLRWATKYEIQYQKDGQWIVYRKTDGTQVSNKQTNSVSNPYRLYRHPNIGILLAQ